MKGHRSGSQISIAFDSRKPIAVPADGGPVKWTRDDGEVFDVSARAQVNGLVQIFKAEDGQRTNTFAVDTNGGMTLTVEITSEQLPKPLTYVLAYRRAGG